MSLATCQLRPNFMIKELLLQVCLHGRQRLWGEDFQLSVYLSVATSSAVAAKWELGGGGAGAGRRGGTGAWRGRSGGRLLGGRGAGVRRRRGTAAGQINGRGVRVRHIAVVGRAVSFIVLGLLAGGFRRRNLQLRGDTGGFGVLGGGGFFKPLSLWGGEDW
jgi:hypothetical protein